MRCTHGILAALLLGIVLRTFGVPSAHAAPADSDNRPVTLHVWIMQNAQERTASTFERLVRPFLADHPGLSVDVRVVPWAEAWSAIELALRTGPAPDIVQLGTSWIATVASTGKLVDLTGVYDEKPFFPESLASMGIAGSAKKGRRYAMPWIIDSRALYYNKAACAKAGVDPSRDFATWETFTVALHKLRGIELGGKQLRPLVVPRNNWDVVHTLAWWIWGWGGDFIPRPPADTGINSPASVAGIEQAIALVRAGLMVHAPEQSNRRVIEGMLERGEAATAIGYPAATLPTDRFGVTLVPAGPQGRFTFLGGSGLAILKSCRHRKAALALIKYLSNDVVQFSYANLTGLLPAAASEYDDLSLELDPVRRVFVEQMRYGRAYPAIPQWGAIERILRDGFNRIWAVVDHPGPYDGVAVRRELDSMAKQIADLM